MTVHRDWLFGWDPTPGIVSVWADATGLATVWRRDPDTNALVRESARFRPWMLLESLDDLAQLGPALRRDDETARVSYRELEGPGELRYLVSANDWATINSALLHGASTRLNSRVTHVRDIAGYALHALPPEEQYLVATGRTYFRDLTFEQLHRLQFDLETTGLDANKSRVFLIAVRDPHGATYSLEARDESDAAERALIAELVALIRAHDPDVIENHNLHGFDLPFLETRARVLNVPLQLGRLHHTSLQIRGARQGVRSRTDSSRRVRFIAPGRELIDTLDAVRRYDFSARDLPSHGLKAVAKHFGISGPDRELIRGDLIYATYRADPDRVRRYATADVNEVAALAQLMGGAAFALARMAPRRYERLADAGAATGVIDPLLVRAYVRAGQALPAHADGDGTEHSGAALHLFATGIAHRVVKADVASLYPSLMRSFRIGPARDHLHALLAIVDQLLEQRLAAKANAKIAPVGSAERFTYEAMSAAMKLVINSAYGYLAAGGSLTRFADVHAANTVTRRGRETLGLMCRELASRGVTLLEADTDGVYFSVPSSWTEADERRVVSEVAALLPPQVQLEYEGRYAAMLSHEPKNYALLSYNGTLIVRGVAFRSSRAEPFGDAFLRQAIECTLRGDVVGVRDAYVTTLQRLHRREIPTLDMSSRVRLSKSSAQYIAARTSRREFSYEALLSSGRTSWASGERARVYRKQNGGGGVVEEYDGEAVTGLDARDYDVSYYASSLRRNFASRLARAFTPIDFDLLFADPTQYPLFAPALADVRAVLTIQHDAVRAADAAS